MKTRPETYTLDRPIVLDRGLVPAGDPVALVQFQLEWLKAQGIKANSISDNKEKTK